jgi:hypothetical protein
MPYAPQGVKGTDDDDDDDDDNEDNDEFNFNFNLMFKRHICYSSQSVSDKPIVNLNALRNKVCKDHMLLV